jgi:hypothetical protein
MLSKLLEIYVKVIDSLSLLFLRVGTNIVSVLLLQWVIVAGALSIASHYLLSTDDHLTIFINVRQYLFANVVVLSMLLMTLSYKVYCTSNNVIFEVGLRRRLI